MMRPDLARREALFGDVTALAMNFEAELVCRPLSAEERRHDEVWSGHKH